MFNEPVTPSVVCRSSQAKEPVEWQADFYASCLLMPRKLIMAAWDEMFPDRRPRVLRPEMPIGHPYVEIERMTDEFGNPIGAADDYVLENFARPFAEQFMVSPIAMRILRLINADKVFGTHNCGLAIYRRTHSTPMAGTRGIIMAT